MALGKTLYSGSYTDTQTVIEIGGFGTDDDITDNSVNRAIKAAEKQFKRFAPSAPADDDIKLGIAYLACYFTGIENGELKGPDSDTTYTKWLEGANNLLGQYLSTTGLIQRMGFMYLSEANTEPANPNAAPYMTMKKKNDNIPIKLP